MKIKAVQLAVVLATLAASVLAAEGPVPQGVPHLDHVLLIMMENHGFAQIVNNPNAPFANQLARSANRATNYFAIGHPSSTNYLEVVGGSNFGVRSDNNPDWHNQNCTPNLVSGETNLDGPVSSGPVCPISGTGTDAATPRLDTTNECPNPPQPCPPGLISIDGSRIPAAHNIVGKSIADQMAAQGLTWMSYQESLPPTGANNISYSDGFYTDNPQINPVPSTEQQTLIKLYAAKHNPFVYFRSVQEGEPGLTLNHVAGFEGRHGLFEDLESGHVPQFSFIVPNQCNDQHGRPNAGPACDFDPNDNGSKQGLNPAVIYLGDLTLRNLVKAIHRSPTWQEGRNAIVVLWDDE